MAEEAQSTQTTSANTQIGAAVEPVSDAIWQIEFANWCASAGIERVPETSSLVSAIRYCASIPLALASLLFLTIRHGGSNAATGRDALAGQATIFALHAEDTTRVRHLRRVIAQADLESATVLLLGRPDASVAQGAHQADPDKSIAGANFIRPLSLRSLFAALPATFGQFAKGLRAAKAFSRLIPLRELVAMNFRAALGMTMADWWKRAAPSPSPRQALFAHTGTADVSLLEMAMQSSGIKTVHVVHGTNHGWVFAGISDAAIFASGADARLAANFPAYGRAMHLPKETPQVSVGNGDWALLTSYTHLQHPDFARLGAQLDCELVEWVRQAAIVLDQDPARIIWRPHPQIDHVPTAERDRLLAAIADAGFTRWADNLPYEALGDFTAVVTTPSTVMTDALRLGQPAIVAELTPLEADSIYRQYPLLVDSHDQLASAIKDVCTAPSRGRAFSNAWAAIEPGANPSLSSILDSLALSAR